MWQLRGPYRAFLLPVMAGRFARWLVTIVGALSLLLVLSSVARAASVDEISASEARVIAEQQAESQVTSAAVTQEMQAADRLSVARPVYLVTLHGHFVYTGAGVPSGAPRPEGDLMEVTVERETGLVKSVHIPASQTVANAANLRSKRGRGRHVLAKSATWSGGHCSEYGRHCYSVANWLMTGSEKVIGVVVYVNTESMNIPEWPSYAEATNEVWARFQSSGYWVEMGTLAGRGDNCCSLTWFHAWENASGFTGVFFEGSITPNTWPYYWIVAIGNGEWCWEVGLQGEATVDCKGGFSTYSNWLNDGMEVASETEPTDVGKVVTSYEALNGSWHTWNKAVNEHEERTCISQFEPYPGNINYSTC